MPFVQREREREEETCSKRASSMHWHTRVRHVSVILKIDAGQTRDRTTALHDGLLKSGYKIHIDTFVNALKDEIFTFLHALQVTRRNVRPHRALYLFNVTYGQCSPARSSSQSRRKDGNAGNVFEDSGKEHGTLECESNR